MSDYLLLDQGLPRSAVTALSKLGYQVRHVADIGMSRSSDSEIIEYARHEGAIVVTLDADFHALIAVAGTTGPSIIRIRNEGLKGEDIARVVDETMNKARESVGKGALITVTDKAIRVHRLPVARIRRT